jgi:hypothetical protein
MVAGFGTYAPAPSVRALTGIEIVVPAAANGAGVGDGVEGDELEVLPQPARRRTVGINANQVRVITCSRVRVRVVVGNATANEWVARSSLNARDFHG